MGRQAGRKWATSFQTAVRHHHMQIMEAMSSAPSMTISNTLRTSTLVVFQTQRIDDTQG
jgi:hypothetical protein